MTASPVIQGLQVPANALVTGASSGIGLAVVRQLLDSEAVAQVIAVSRSAGAHPALQALQQRHGARLRTIAADLGTDAGIAALEQQVSGEVDALHLVFNAAGMLHGPGLVPEKSLATLSRDALQDVFALNAFAPILLAQSLSALLRHGQPAVFASLSARVGSIGDNQLGGWYAYRASKAAQNQLLRTLAVEWKRTHAAACVLLLHPGTVDTPLSRPFQAHVPAAKLFTPERAATQLLDIIARSTPGDSGRFLAWDGSEIPW